MSCDRHTDAIVDHACGAALTAEAAAHLDGCTACRRLLDEQRRLVLDLDEQLALALEVEPSPRFVPSVMARVERSTSDIRGARWWGGAATAAAVLLLVTFGSLRFTERRDEEQRVTKAPSNVVSSPVADRRPSPVTRSTSPVGDSRPIDSRRRVDRPRSVVGRPETGADVVVPATDAGALARYLALVRRGALDTSTLPSPDEAGVAAPSELVIAPLTVDTLAMTDVKAAIGPVSRGEPGTR